MAITVSGGGGGSGSIDGTIGPGTSNAIAYYPSATTTIAPSSMIQIDNGTNRVKIDTGDIEIVTLGNGLGIFPNGLSSYGSSDDKNPKAAINLGHGNIVSGYNYVGSDDVEICNRNVGFLIIFGRDAYSASFYDIVLKLYSTPHVVLSSNTTSGTPDTRTYTSTDPGSLLLRMGGSTYYDVNVTGFSPDF